MTKELLALMSPNKASIAVPPYRSGIPNYFFQLISLAELYADKYAGSKKSWLKKSVKHPDKTQYLKLKELINRFNSEYIEND